MPPAASRQPPPALDSAGWILAGATIYDATMDRPLRRDLGIVRGLIAQIGDGLRGDTVLHATWRSVIPGLIDAHVHIMLESAATSAFVGEHFNTPFLRLPSTLRTILHQSFTTVLNAGGADAGGAAAIESGLIDGPQLVRSISLLSQTGGHGDVRTVRGDVVPLLAPHPGRPSGVVDSPERMRVRELVAAGAQVIKVCASGGVATEHDDPMAAQFSIGELEACVREVELMREYGTPARAVLAAATTRGAGLLGRSDRGLIRAGLRGDLVVLDGDPLDIPAWKRTITSTIARGRCSRAGPRPGPSPGPSRRHRESMSAAPPAAPSAHPRPETSLQKGAPSREVIRGRRRLSVEC